MSTDTPPPDRDVTQPGAIAPELAAILDIARRDILVQELRELRAVIEAQRMTLAPVVAADVRWSQARALLAEAVADGWRAQLGPVRVGSLVLLLTLGSGCLAALSAVGVAVDLGALTDAAAHAWSGQPHRVECEPPASGPLSPVPSGRDGPG
jgi:hypothetical protein